MIDVLEREGIRTLDPRVEAGEPHVPHEHDPERLGGITKAFPSRRALFRLRDCQSTQFSIEIDTDTPANSGYHRLAFERFQSLLEVLDNVLCDELQTFFGSDDSFKLRPLGLELFPALNFFAFGGFLEVRVDFRCFALVERQLGKARQSPQLRRGGEMA